MGFQPTAADTPSGPHAGNSSTRRWRLATVPLALAATVAGAGLLIQETAPTPAAASGSTGHRDTLLTKLSCSGQAVVTTSAPITDAPTSVSITAVGTYDDCFAENGGPANVLSATFTFAGSGTISCSSPSSFSGTETITWYSGLNQTGSVVGTSTVTTNGAQPVEGDPAHEEILDSTDSTVSLGSTVLPGAGVVATFEPTSDISNCSNGLSSMTVKHDAAFSALL
ncbi:MULTISPECIES: hypothetical protein [Streptomycetaceae]|uniref:hypothetical protein n=1 Tax=Streptomycetaceae TaxID=2062 RepID=UPI00093B9726|nr:hypothetical protein [Streptomyces sp. CB02056]OKI05523.1 hypothetical protein AMK13_19310 [Streptomyces sp. CB02056]